MKKTLITILPVTLLLYAGSTQATTILLDFEDIPDLISVGDFYSSQGVTFTNSISLTAGFSLNETDYPPSSGVRAVGDDNAPIKLIFGREVNDIAANFTFAYPMTFTAFDAADNLIGFYTTPQTSNLGSTEHIALNFSNVSFLTIDGHIPNNFIMDDLTFTTVPEPGALLLMGIGLLAGLRRGLKQAVN